MKRCVSYLLFSLLLLSCGQSQSANALQIDVEKLFDQVGNFVPQAKPLIQIAQRLWKGLDMIKEYYDHPPEKPSDREVLDDINDKVEEVNNNVLEVDNKVEKSKNQVAQEVIKDHKLVRIHENLMKVFSRFETFVVYQRRGDVNERDLIDFYETQIKHGSDRLTELLYIANNMVTEDETNTELMELITDPEQSVGLMCKRKQSPMHVINNLYNQITSAELKAMILTRYSYWYLYNDTASNNGSIEAYDEQVERRLTKTILKMKDYMKIASREFWTCNSGTTYRKLSPIFHTYILPERDGGELVNGKIKSYGIKESCKYFQKKTFYDVCVSFWCKYIHKTKCEGYIRDCYTHNQGSNMEICLADRNSGRRYNKVKIGKEVLGQHIECANYKIEGRWWDRNVGLTTFFRASENCLCTCDDHFNNEANRYFSLKEVTSDIDENKVITGARITLKNKVFQFDVQQAAVTGYGNINHTSVKWKNEFVNPSIAELQSGAGYHKITWDNKIVNLDVLDSPANTVLTGLRFNVENKALKLEIRYTPFDFTSGTMYPKDSKWIPADPKDKRPRPEIKFKTELPRGNSYKPDEGERAFLKFTISSLKQDIGQNVVPFIDTARVVGTPATLLSGAGLIYKGSSLTAGFLSIKLITYNFEPHLNESEK